MSRSGYNEDCDGWALVRYRGAVNSAIKGARGQKLLAELAGAMDEMPEKKLIAEELEANGCHCALGVVGKHRGLALENIDPEDARGVSKVFDIAEALAREIVFENDYDYGTYYDKETPEQRWARMRQWVDSHLIASTAGAPA